MSARTIFLIILAIAVSVFTIIVQWRVKSGKIILRSTYSYKPIIRVTSIMLCIGILMAVLVYFRTSSLEAALTVGAYLSAVILGGSALAVLSQYQVKRRGGRKVD
jgi:membrane protein CcdC involved in cytochrome C biogenesis